jgi:hypothetical protein
MLLAGVAHRRPCLATDVEMEAIARSDYRRRAEASIRLVNPGLSDYASGCRGGVAPSPTVRSLATGHVYWG